MEVGFCYSDPLPTGSDASLWAGSSTSLKVKPSGHRMGRGVGIGNSPYVPLIWRVSQARGVGSEFITMMASERYDV